MGVLALELGEIFVGDLDHLRVLDGLEQLDEPVLGESAIKKRDVDLGLVGLALAGKGPDPAVGLDEFAEALEEMALLFRMPAGVRDDVPDEPHHGPYIPLVEFHGPQTKHKTRRRFNSFTTKYPKI